MKKKFLFETNQSRDLLFDFQFQLYHDVQPRSRASEDFGWQLLPNGVEYLKSLNNPNIKDWKRIIPIGSVEFVLQFFKSIYDINLKPINIPDVLWSDEYLGREVATYRKQAVEAPTFALNGYNKFIKSETLFKDTVEIYRNKEQLRHIQKNLTTEEVGYLVSDVVDILSEYRVFVHRDKIEDVRRYSGEYKVFPDMNLIEKMVRELSRDKATPVSYTLDVAVTLENKKERTILIEMHDFFSVGLYGFDSYKLPYMFSQWYYEKLRREGTNSNKI